MDNENCFIVGHDEMCFRVLSLCKMKYVVLNSHLLLASLKSVSLNFCLFVYLHHAKGSNPLVWYLHTKSLNEVK